MTLVQVDRRVLGAIGLVDATTRLPIARRLQVSGRDLHLVWNRSGYAVIYAAEGLQAYSESFLAPASPVATVSIQVSVIDPEGQYLSRQATIKLPRDPDSANADTANSVFQPISVAMYRSPAAQVASGWAVIRATAIEKTTSQRLPWALIRVVQSAPAKVTLCLADWRGDALINVAGIPITTPGAGGGAVLVNEIDVTLEIVFDPVLTKISTTSDLSTLADPNAGYLPDPDDLEVRRGSLRSGSLSYKLAAGRDRADTLAVTFI
ncbi:MAG: hypothetical protein H7126_06480 [Candidatus Parcubacteria bacterium]|uniref:hypothetical protein n=1 Tax=Phormidesmis priestleyi TaxID=268141 RepID=UPI00083B4093|nr:hypothetical protein [Phormidesmis priestleyi]MBC7823512.1 hypothetical protein [Leptolyngbyaceae cyanobacterium LF-bin-113]